MAFPKPLQFFFLDLYEKNFFKDLNSVIDMGDQDLAGDLKYQNSAFLNRGITLNSSNFERSKYYPQRPRTSSITY